jgi:hypothetical protein
MSHELAPRPLLFSEPQHHLWSMRIGPMVLAILFGAWTRGR